MRTTHFGTLAANNVTVVHGTHPVLTDVSVILGPRARLGVVGPNGVGKSTLLRVLAGADAPDSGRVERSPNTLTVGYLPQEVVGVDGESLLSYLARRTGVAEAGALLDAATAALADGSGTPEMVDAHAEALDRFLALGGDDLEARAAEVCAAIGLGSDELGGSGLGGGRLGGGRLGSGGLGGSGLGGSRLGRPLAGMSGGQRARAGLAAILLSRFDVLLLDEPTNDLDFAGLEQLERFVTDTSAAVAVVSHDRAFLDHVVDRVLELDGHAHTAREYAGGWKAYVEEQALARQHGYEDYERYRTEHQRLLDRSRQQRRWAERGRNRAVRRPADPDKNLRHRHLQATERLAAKARATERAMKRLDVVEKPWEGWTLRLALPPAPRSSDVVVRLQEAVVARGAFRLGPVDLELRWQDRLAVVGPNGSGKTTLLEAVLGRIPLTAGDRHWGSRVVVGELDQARHVLAGAGALIDAFCAEIGMAAGEARTLLAKFELGAHEVVRSAATLSPGERTRALVALLVAKEVNLLVLDEPTNHLDLPAIEQLESALESYDGTLILVTHDRRLLDAVRITSTVDLSAG
ncbi:MAG: ABC-F family ATP-binding cassette domain-containing protein [Acidimicrobiia bacterium]|nr:ABC-F family ATP-binding cassette domain-containing protein [Acidimicrobiia bacterium]